MALSVESRRLILGAALLLTVVVSAWMGTGQAEEEAEIVEPAKPVHADRDNVPRRAAPALPLPVLAEARAAAGDERQAGDVFESHRWFVAPPPPRQVQVAVAPPAPPPLPFTYLGAVRDDGRTTVFLVKEQRLYTVRNGEVFDGKYRMESDGNGRIELVYLPLNARQILVAKGAS